MLLTGPMFMVILALILRPYVLKLLSNLLQQRIQDLTSSTLTQLFLAEIEKSKKEFLSPEYKGLDELR